MHKLIGRLHTLILAALCAAPGAAHAEGQVAGGLPPSAFSRSGRGFDYLVPVVRTLTSPGGTSCTILTGTVTVSTENGRDGQIMDISFSSVTSVSETSFGAMLYPNRVVVDFYDAATVGTLACTSMVISGYDWAGEPVTETLLNIAETTSSPRYTTHAFSAITRVTAAGCSGGAALDRLRIRHGPWVAMPYKVSQASDVTSICTVALNSSFTIADGGYSFPTCAPGSSFTFDFPSNTVLVLDSDLDGISGTTLCPRDRIGILIRGRANPRESRY